MLLFTTWSLAGQARGFWEACQQEGVGNNMESADWLNWFRVGVNLRLPRAPININERPNLSRRDPVIGFDRGGHGHSRYHSAPTNECLKLFKARCSETKATIACTLQIYNYNFESSDTASG